MQHRHDDLQRLLELLEPLGEGVEVESQLPVLELEPSGADAQDGPPRADDVQGRDHLGEQGRIAIGVAGHQRRQLHPLGGRGQRPERRIRLEHGFVGLAQSGQLIEVVHQEHGVEAGGLGFRGLRFDRGK